jgi:beta-ribofuranosylaminobenzene 5'-phosphate synthase
MHFTIRTPCRIHCTLIDLNGQLGRVDGGFGVALNAPSMVLDVDGGSAGLQLDARPDALPILKEIVENLSRKDPSLKQNVKLTLKDYFPPHIGLGSKTQLSLAVVTALLRSNGVPENAHIAARARLVERGGTSGVGCIAFEQGGFILDGGHTFGPGAEKQTFLPSSASKTCMGPLLARFDVPKEWRFVLVTPNVRPGAHDQEEVNIFQRCCPIPIAEVQALSHVILMQVLPSIATGNISTFGHAINAIQQVGFKRIEVSLQADVVQKLLPYLVEQGACGAGMSSFGPTVYAITDSGREAQNLAKAGQEFISDVGGSVVITTANNQGAEIRGNP